MKTKLFNFALVALAFAVFAACTPKEEPKPDAPVITKITSVDDLETELTEVALNQSIAIHGEHFVDVTAISVNTIDLDVREAYVTETRIDVVVPRVIPDNPNNKVIVTTKGGTAEKSVTVNLPKLVIKGFKNEFAADGEEVEIVGENFDLFQIDKANAILKFNGAPIEMKESSATSFSIVIPEGTPWPADPYPWHEGDHYTEWNFLKDYGEPSYLSIESPGINGEIKVPFRDQGVVGILTNDRDTWWNGWWPTGIVQSPFDGFDLIKDITPFYKWVGYIKMTTANAWQYENVTYEHWWIPECAKDIEAHPEDYCIKMEILNPATTPLPKYMRLGSALVEAAATENDNHFLMWDPASYNEGISFNTMGKWQTVSFEVRDLFYPLEAGKNTSLVFTENPAATFDDENTFKIAMQREEPGDIEFYFWNIRIAKKLKYTY